MAVAKVTCPADVSAMNWKGNFHDDSRLFEMVDVYLRDETTSRVDACEALYLMSKHGMGYDAPVDEAELDLYLNGKDA